MNELTEEEVLHIAHLARIEISHDEMESYKKELNEIMNQINRVNEVNIDTCDYIFSPTENKNEYIPDFHYIYGYLNHYFLFFYYFCFYIYL